MEVEELEMKFLSRIQVVAPKIRSRISTNALSSLTLREVCFKSEKTED